MGRKKNKPRPGKRTHQHQPPKANPKPPVQPQTDVAAPAPATALDQTKTQVGQNPGHENDDRQMPSRKRFVRWFSLGRGMTAALVVFTGLQALYAVRTWDAMIDQNAEMILQREEMAKQNKISQGQLDMMHAEQRAWLNMVDPKLEWNYFPNSSRIDAESKIGIKNNGKNPAYVTLQDFDLVEIQQGERVEEVLARRTPRPSKHDASIAPGDTVYAGTVLMAPDHRFHTYVTEGKVTLWLVGEVAYTDITGQQRHTYCRYKYDPESKTFTSYFRGNR